MGKRPRTELLNLLSPHLTDSQYFLTLVLLSVLSTFSPIWSLLGAGQLANPSPDTFISSSIPLPLETP